MKLTNNAEGYILSKLKLFTLIDVIKLDLKSLVNLYELVCKHVISLSKEYIPKDLLKFSQEMVDSLVGVNELSESFNLTMTAKQLSRVFEINKKVTESHSNVKQYDHYMVEYRGAITELKHRLEDELELQVSFRLSPEYHKFLENQFSNEAIDYFGDLGFDMDEACNCIAFERFTATAFHLMRISEGAVKALTTSLDIKCDHSSWAHIIAKLKKYVDGLPKAKMKEANELREIILSVELVKDAWRNRIMHLEEKYNFEEVKKIFDSTNRLITEIANKLTKE